MGHLLSSGLGLFDFSLGRVRVQCARCCDGRKEKTKVLCFETIARLIT